MFRINKDVRTKPEVKEIIVFKDEDLQKIFDNLKTKNSNFRTMISLAYYTGLRSTDMLSINIEKINFENNSISYYSPKLKKWYIVPFHKHLTSVLKERMQDKKTGKLLEYTDDSDMCKAFNRYLTELELTGKGYTMRTFRKTFITLCRSRYNMNASIVRELVGHEHGNTADRYYNEISIDNMRVELLKFRRPKFKAAK